MASKGNWSGTKDFNWDKAHGIKEDSKHDRQLDKQRGIKERDEKTLTKRK